MLSCRFLILGFLDIVFCATLTNFTGEDTYPDVCPVKLARWKRANVEYTRWRSNMATSPEFIVKIFDEDISTPSPPIVAVNIQPVTERGEKIIVGGVMVPQPSTMQVKELAREYTRFVPPTTIPVTQVEEELFLAPVPQPPFTPLHKPIKPDSPGFKRRVMEGKFAERDESPPASPQFLRGSTSPVIRQFAPIAQVSFSRKYTLAPMQTNYDKDKKPTRTSLSDDFFPQRTVLENVPIFNSFPTNQGLYTNTDLPVSRSAKPYEPPAHTEISDLTTYSNAYDNFLTTTENIETEKQNDIYFRKHGKDKDISDISYQDMFQYNDDYKDTTVKKQTKDIIDHYHLYHEDIEAIEKEHSVVFASDVIEWGRQPLETTPKTTQITTPTTSTTTTNTTPKTVRRVELTTEANVVSEGEKKDKDRSKRRPVCNLFKARKLNFSSARFLHEIVSQLKIWADRSPLAKLVDITDGNFTVMENPIYMMMIDDPSSGQIITAKQTVMVVAGSLLEQSIVVYNDLQQYCLPGIQGRDHHAVAAALYLLYQLIERSEAHSDLLSKYRFWIIPVFNPDGYDYSMMFPHRREWMKNLRQSWEICKGRESCLQCASHGLRCNIQPCYGVNLDRNFEYQWIPPDELKAEHPCGSLYAGTRQLSECETKALTHYLHEQKTPLFTFIAFKEGDVLGIMYPYSHTRKRRAYDHVYRQRASRAASAAYSISGRPYVAGQTSEFLPLYAGGIEDWIDGHLGIDNTYTIMLFRPTDSYHSKVITERVVHEAYAAMDTLLLQNSEGQGSPVVAQQASKNMASDSTRVLPSPLLLTSLPALLYSVKEVLF